MRTKQQASRAALTRESSDLCDLLLKALGYDASNPEHDTAVMYSAGFVHIRNADVRRVLHALTEGKAGDE